MKAQRKAACQLTATATHRRVTGIEVALDPAELFQFLERSTIARIGHDTSAATRPGLSRGKHASGICHMNLILLPAAE
jgi:hypothetical protein